jgi:thioredoxin 1
MLNDEYTLMAFKAPWCFPCKAMEPILRSVLNLFSDMKFISVNIDEDTKLATEYEVRQIPTLLLVKDNNEVDRLVGSHSAEQIKEFISKRT